MTTEMAVLADDDRRQAALLKAINLDKVPPEQREIALAIARRYDLDLLLKHLVLIEGRPYVTRDGLLWIAHRSGQLDGMEVSDPAIVTIPGPPPGGGEFWRATCTVYRKDMSHPFTYAGRYPTRGGNVKFAPEMAVKVAEVMSLRRAFNVSASTVEERWDLEPPTLEVEPELTPRQAFRAWVVEQKLTPDEVTRVGDDLFPERDLKTLTAEEYDRLRSALEE